MGNDKMTTIQLYVTEELHGLLNKTFGQGKMSANVERILRAQLLSPAQEQKLRLQELNREVRRFNADFMTGAELIFPEEAPPKPPEEEGT
jgi:hypothetical protein